MLAQGAVPKCPKRSRGQMEGDRTIFTLLKAPSPLRFAVSLLAARE